ncbi:hypothetical protein GALL_103310 [mine drainage metagenome]|uniref:Uncharacterized protein n=1 Tax=mine drainage metagenome TaxID=410659 RepID=A0A1J5SH04_9ZZZZ
MCQPIAVKSIPFYSRLWYAFTCNALRVLRRLSHYLQFLLIRHGSSCVLQPASFIRSSFRFISPRSPLTRFASVNGTLCQLTHPSTSDAHFLMQAIPSGSLGFITLHSSLLHFSRLQSTRCQYFLLAGSPTTASFSKCWPTHIPIRTFVHSYLISQSSTKLHLHSSGTSVS